MYNINLSDVVDERIDLTTRPVPGVTGQTFDELSNLSVLSDFGTADITYPWEGYGGRAYPFPAIIKNERGTGQFVHYGNWVGTTQEQPSALVVYYEKYKIKATGKSQWRYSYLRPNGTVTGNLPKNEGTIEESGYGVLVLDKAELPEITGIDASEYRDAPNDADKISLSYGMYALRPFSDDVLAELSKGEDTKELTITYTTTDDESGTTIEKTLDFCLNVKFAEAISVAELSEEERLGGVGNPFGIRTLGQLKNMTADHAVLGSHFEIRESIHAGELEKSLVSEEFVVDGGYEAGGKRIRIDGYVGEVGSDGCYIFGLRRPLFESISDRSQIENLALLDVQVTGTEENGITPATLAVQNNGTISSCIVNGNVVSGNGRGAGGLVQNNAGTIKGSYFSGTVTGLTHRLPEGISLTDHASAFVLNNKGTIDNCYASGTAKGNKVAGIALTNEGTVKNTYAVVDVTGGTTKHVFTGSSKSVTNCYWARNTEEPPWNNDSGLAAIDGATEKNLSELSGANMGTDWSTKEDKAGTYPATDACKDKGYGYPKFKNLDHYGDWPIPVKKGTGAFLVGFGYMKQNRLYNIWEVDDGMNVTHIKNDDFGYQSSGLVVSLPPDPSDPSGYGERKDFTCKIAYSEADIRTVNLTNVWGITIANRKVYEMKEGYMPIFGQPSAIYIENNITGQKIKFSFNGTVTAVEDVTE